MLRRHQEVYVRGIQFVDAGLLCFSLFLAHTIRDEVLKESFYFSQVAPFVDSLWAVLLLFLLGPFILERQGFYRITLGHRWSESFAIMVRSVFILLLVLVVFMVLWRIPQVTISRATFLLFPPVAVTLLGIREFFWQRWLQGYGRRQIHRQRLFICGRPEERERWKKDFNAAPGVFYEVMEEIDLREVPSSAFVHKLHQHHIDLAVFTVDHTNLSEIREALIACQSEGVEAWVGADFFRTSVASPTLDQFLHRPLLIYRCRPGVSGEFITKRIFDVAFSVFLLVVLSPLFLVLVLLIRCFCGAPIFFTQRRSGLFGRPFTMYKFRTMVPGAEEDQVRLQSWNEIEGPAFKLQQDPRVTGLGRWLRKTSLDELPQLWNVLKGEMSLVGPRPLPLYETERFSPFSYRRRMSVPPGMTGLWQIKGRSEIRDFDEWVRLDLEYIDQWSFPLDLWILLQTIPVVLRGRGAQ